MDDFANSNSNITMDSSSNSNGDRTSAPLHMASLNELTHHLDHNGNDNTGTGNETPEHNNSPVGQQLDYSEKEQVVRWPASPSAPSSSAVVRCIEAQQIREINYPKPESIEEDTILLDETLVRSVEEPLEYLIDRQLSAQEKRKSNSSDLMDLNDNSVATTTAEPITTSASVYTGLSHDEAFRDFQLTCSAKEIAKVLETFNAILEDGDNADQFSSFTLQTDSNNESENCMKIVDNFAHLLIGGENEEEDLLIVVDNSDQSLLSQTGNNNINNNNEANFHMSQHQDQQTSTQQNVCHNDDDDDSLTQTGMDDEEYYYPDDTEGYESDRPMVRASMRRLRPVQLLPMPTNPVMFSYTIPESPCPSPGHNAVSESPIPSSSNSPAIVPAAVVPGSPLTNNRILVTSLVNNIIAPSSLESNGSTSDLPEFRVVNEVSNPIYGDALLHHAQVTRVPSNGRASSPDVPRGTSSGFPDIVPAASASHGNAGTSSPSSSNRPNNGQSATSGVSSSTSTSSSTSSSSSSSSSSTQNISSSLQNTSNNSSTNSTPSRGGNIQPTITTSTTTATTVRENRPLRWPHRLSSVLALIGCTVGLNNICRFSLLSVEYGANFILQFLFLSLVFGIPLLTFHMSIGQYLSSGIIDMWKISPIFQGIGIGLVISQAVIGIYTAVGVSWVFIYFRDSFITRYDQYRWGKCFREYRDCNFSWTNQSNFAETVPDYFNGVVLQRETVEFSNPTLTSGLKFTVAFNLAVVWMLVFVSLSKGLKSYGKVIHGLILLPVAGLLVLASKVVGLVPTDHGGALYVNTAWSNFFFNSQTWLVAAREAFFTWGLLGACVMQVTSHNRFGHNLKSDASIVVLITTFVLLLGAFIANACYAVITANQYNYVPSSFESARSSQFLVHSASESRPDTYLYNHISFLMGVRIIPLEMSHLRKSGYQALRLATELFPTTMAMLSPTGLSPFWTVLFYFILILFGIAQQVAIWHCVIRAVIAAKSKVLREWEITITVCVCATGFVLGLILCTELGIFIEYFMDYVVGSGWWIIVLYLLELVAVFIVRGAPYCGENIVTVLMTGPGKLMTVLAPLLSFVWNVILPVAMLVLSIASFKSGNIRELYDWNPNHGYEFWPSWIREVGSFMQLLPILAVPFVAIVQSCRYLSNGPPDLFERMQRLYRPSSRGLFNRPNSPQMSGNNAGGDFAGNSPARSEDPPPKYTPPPSYSTATGAKIAKFLRSSIRRSMRRFTGPSTSSTADLPPPPNYASVILEINAQQLQQQQNLCNSNPSTEASTHVAHSVNTALTPILLSSSTRIEEPSDSKSFQAASQTLGKSLTESKERASLRRIASDITPRDIARLLRASFRRSASPELPPSASIDQNNFNYTQAQPSSGAQHSALNIEVDFLRIPSNSDLRLNLSASNDNYTGEASQSLTSCGSSGSGSRSGGKTNVHIRSVSTGGGFMGHPRGSTTDSQTTLISHSSSQNDLSHLISNDPALDFRLRGIVNPGFQFSHNSVHTLRNGRDSLNQSDA